MQRRNFLAGVAGVSLASGRSVAAISPRWESLARSLSGRLVQPGEAGFKVIAEPNNLRYASIVPAGIAVCANAADVSASILWARRNQVTVVARSGGHSYAGYSCTTGLMIDVTHIKNVAFDADTGIVAVGTGARLRDLFGTLEKHNVAITHGNCLSNGVAGFVLGGGIGLNMRRYGLACDQLRSIEIVTAGGDVHVVDAKTNSELFWALRGGAGGNFGISTRFALQTFSAGRLTAFDLTWKDANEKLYIALAKALESAPDTFGTQGAVVAPNSSGGAVRIELLGQFAGSRDGLTDILAPVYALGRPSGRIVHAGYWRAQRQVIEEPGSPGYSSARSRFFRERIDESTVAMIFAWLRRAPEGPLTRRFTFFLTGGRINATAPNATAFVHRNSRWLGRIDVVWGADAPRADLRRNLAWQTEFYDAIVPVAKGGVYQNFTDPALDDWKSAYYGTNLARLEAVRKRVDPAHVFRFAQAIP